MKFKFLLFNSILLTILLINTAYADSDYEISWTSYTPDYDSSVIYVSSSEGNDDNDGLSTSFPVATIAKAASLVRDGEYDFILLKRGDVWRDETLGRFKSGKDADHPMVISSYGSSDKRPLVKLGKYFINHDGKVRNYISILGINFLNYKKDPNDDEFDGKTSAGFRFVGGGKSILIEGCRFTYTGIIVQSYGLTDGVENTYNNITMRGNVIEKSYHIDTTNDKESAKPSGMFASHVNNLLIEDNLFDHNGWNEDVDTADATMYNHNIYISHCNNITLQNNIFSRASSIGVKFRSNKENGSKGINVLNNIFTEGEVGISFSGSYSGIAKRFKDVNIKGNIFTRIGESNPTSRNFSWGIYLTDTRRASIEDNYFVNQDTFENSHGIIVEGYSVENVNIKSNKFFNIYGNNIVLNTQPTWNGSVSIHENQFVTHLTDYHNMIRINDSDNFYYILHNNKYYSLTRDYRFSLEGYEYNFSDWKSVSGEKYSLYRYIRYYSPTRSIASYAKNSLGLEKTLLAFLTHAREQSPLHWQSEYSAQAVKAYFDYGMHRIDN